MKKLCYLLTVLLSTLALAACGGESMSGGTWTPVEDYTYSFDEATGWMENSEMDPETIEAVREAAGLDDYTIVWVEGDSVVYAPYYETALMEGVTFAKWDGEALTTVYQFQEGTAMSFQQFFNPGGTMAVMSWRPDDQVVWTVRLVDMETGETRDLTLPEWDGETLCVFSRWTNEDTLRVTAVEDLASGSNAAAWEYTLP